MHTNRHLVMVFAVQLIARHTTERINLTLQQNELPAAARQKHE